LVWFGNLAPPFNQPPPFRILPPPFRIPNGGGRINGGGRFPKPYYNVRAFENQCRFV
jgi:hypothetical protein